jgi:hypothetical protein
VRDSSLSACPQGVIAAEVGHLDLAYDNWAETALTDLRDLHRNPGSGLHIAALAGAWTLAVPGFGGMRDHDGRLTLAPCLPAALSRLSFRLTFQERCLLVDIRRDQATYQLLSGDPRRTAHHGKELTVVAEVSRHAAHSPCPSRRARHPAPGRAAAGGDDADRQPSTGPDGDQLVRMPQSQQPGACARSMAHSSNNPASYAEAAATDVLSSWDTKPNNRITRTCRAQHHAERG